MEPHQIKVNIVGRIDSKTSIGRMTHAFINALREFYACRFIDTRPDDSELTALPIGVQVISHDDPIAMEADVSIFTDVTSNGYDDANWQRVPPTKLKYAYSVFDSTRIPLAWADILNNHFDAVFVTARFLVESYRRSQVHKPVFYLPLALDLQPYLKLPAPRQRNSRNFVFGFIGSREPRKNIDMLVDCFVAAFSDSDSVSLKIHCALDFLDDKNYFGNLRLRSSNIFTSHGVLPEKDYQELFSTIDCFVSISRGEGFSIIPRQFLAAGKPVLLSDCFAHAEILAELKDHGPNLALSVESDIPVSAIYPHVFGGGPFGVQFEPMRISVIEALRRVYSDRATLFQPECVESRREWARKFDEAELRPLYRSVVEPAFVRKATGDELESGGISTRDENLLSRISGRNYAAGLTQVLREKPVKYVVIGNDGGFFSVFNRFVSYLTWAMSEHPESIVLPDWRISAMRTYWQKDTFTSFCYGTEADGNLWLKLFEPLPYPDYPPFAYEDSVALYRNAELKDDFNEKSEPWLTYIHAYKLYKSPSFQRWRNWYHLHLSTYVRLLPHIAKRVDDFYAENLRGFRVISAHIRHPSHGIEQPGVRLPTVDLYCEKIRALMNKFDLHPKETRIFLATDQASVVDQMLSEFGEMIVYGEGSARTTREHDAAFNRLGEAEKMREGFQVQHLTAADPAKWSIKMAEDVLFDTYLLARGDHFVHITSNIATAVSYINPRMRMHYCE